MASAANDEHMLPAAGGESESAALPPSENASSAEAIAPRKRLRDGAADEHESATKRARFEGEGDGDAALMDALAADPARARALIGGLGDSAAAAIEDAVNARNLKLECEQQKRLEDASPFNASCNSFAVFGNIFCAHVLPHVPPEDACALRLQSRTVRDWVDTSGRVAQRHLSHTLKTPSMCHMAPEMFARFLAHATTTDEVLGVALTSATMTADADTSAEMITDTMSRVATQVDGMSRFYALYFCMSRFGYYGSHDGPGAWSDVCDGEPIDAGDACTAIQRSRDPPAPTPAPTADGEPVAAPALVRAPVYHLLNISPSQSLDPEKFRDDESTQQKIFLHIIIGNLEEGLTRMSPRLMKVLLGNRMIDRYDVCREADQFAAALIHTMDVRERADLPIAQDVAALEFLLEFMDDCAMRNVDFALATAAITTCKVSAPLADIMRVPIVTKKRSAGPLTHAAQKNNPTALRYIARRALAEGVSNKAQARVVSLVAREGYIDCLRVLCEELFVVAPPTLVKLMIGSRLPWATDSAKRTIAFDAILEDVGMCISRGSLGSMIASLDDAIALKIFPKVGYARFGKIPKVESDSWGTTVAGDFLSSLWRATSGDARLRNAVASMHVFREAVNHALIAHLACKFLPAAHSDVHGYTDATGVSDAMSALLSRIAELLDMQRRTDWSIDLEDGSAEALSPVRAGLYHPEYIKSLHGAIFDRWMRKLFVVVSTAGMCYIDAAEAAASEITGIFSADVVHTDIAFQNVVKFAAAAPGFGLVDRRWVAALLFKACSADTRNAAGTPAATRTDLARRLMRWCAFVGASILDTPNQEADGVAWMQPASGYETYLMLRDIAAAAITAQADEVVGIDALSKSDAPVPTSSAAHQDPPVDCAVNNAEAVRAAIDGSVTKMCLRVLFVSLKEFVVTTCSDQLSGVEVLYDTYGGDAVAALGDLTTGLIDGPIIPEPQGLVRDIVIYEMASARTLRNSNTSHTEVEAEIAKTVSRYTEGVTLPCTWSAGGGVKGNRDMSRWLRDLLRGRKSHTVWWSRKS